jgi:hypothetical protein
VLVLELSILLVNLLCLAWLVIRQEQTNKRLIMTADEAVAQLVAIKEQNSKALGEIRGKLDGLLQTIQDLQDAILNQPLPQVVADAIAEVAASSQALDDVVPDAPPA